MNVKDLWLDIVFWGGATGFTLGLAGACIACALRFLGYRRVNEIPEARGRGPSDELGGPPGFSDWFTTWTLVGCVLGGSMGLVFWVDRVT